MDDWVDLRVKSNSRLTADVVMLELISITNQALPRFEAGAYIDIQIPSGILRPLVFEVEVTSAFGPKGSAGNDCSRGDC